MRFLMLVLLLAVVASARTVLVMDPIEIKGSPLTTIVMEPVTIHGPVLAMPSLPGGGSDAKDLTIEDIEAVNVARSQIKRLQDELRASRSERRKRYILAQIKVQRQILALSR